jgi:PAS domain S-box-containing protein
VAVLSPVCVEARTWTDIRGSGELRICTAGSSAAFYQVNAEAFARYLGVQAKVTQLADWDQQFHDSSGATVKEARYEARLLADGQCDLYPNDLHITDWRQTKMLLVPYYKTRKMIVAHRGHRNVLKQESDLAGHKAAVQKGTAYETWIRSQNESRFKNHPIQLELAPTDESMKRVAEHLADFTVIGAEGAFKWVRGDQANLDMLFPVDDIVSVGWGLSVSATDLRPRLEAFFADSFRVGSELDRSWQRQYGISLMEYHLFESSIDSGETKRKAMLAWVVPLMAGLGGMVLAMLFWTRRLKREVDSHRKTEIALGQSEANYKELVHNVNAIILRMNLEGKVTYFNEYAEQFFGYRAEEILGRHVVGTIVPPQESGTSRDLSQMITDILADPKRFADNENENMTRDGRRVIVRWANQVIHDEKGKPTGVLSIGTDITVQKQAETALQESEIRLRIIADNTFDWESWQAPATGRFFYVSPSCEAITGYTADEFKADPGLVLRIIHPADQHLYASHLHNIEDKGLCEVEFRIQTKAGDTRWIAHGCRPVFGSDGSYLGRRASNRDVTAAKEAELQYRTIVQTARDGYLVIAQDTHFIDTNDAYCRMLGYQRDELLALKIADIEAEEDPEEVQRHSAEIRRNGHAQFETRHRRKDGMVIDVEVTVQYLDLYGGVLISFVRDITERKVIEWQLAGERQRFKDFSASTADWFWEMDANLRFSYFSDNFEKAYGLNPETVLGKSRPELLAKDQLNPQPLLDAHVAQLERHEPFRDFEYRIRDSAGNIQWISISGIPFHDQADSFAGYRGVGQVVTDRKNAEDQLRESQERQEAAASAGIVGVWDWDVVNDRLIWDKVMYQLYGFHEAGFGGAYEAWARAIHPEDRAYTEGEIQAALRGESEYAPKFRIIWPDGSIHHLQAKSHTTFDAQGKPLRMVGVNYDITEQKNIEAMLEEGIANRTQELKKARDAAEAANVAKSAFLSNMSHEMRTPLHHITGLAQMIRREPLTPKQVERFEMLEQATYNLTASVDTILNLTKIEADQFGLVDQPFNPRELLDEVLASVQTQALAKQLHLNSTLANVPATLVGDKSHLKDALLNYVANAIRFTEAGTISVRINLVTELGSFVLVRFEVEDSGPGIDPQDLPRLFSIFEQVDNSSTRKYGGLGMGLAMTKKIAEIMGGEAGCDSKPGKGSTFWFTVRLKKA